jgi:hypothetical protein
MDKYDKEFEKWCKEKKKRGCAKYSQIGGDVACCNCERVWLKSWLQQEDKMIDLLIKIIGGMERHYNESAKAHRKKNKQIRELLFQIKALQE